MHQPKDTLGYVRIRYSELVRSLNVMHFGRSMVLETVSFKVTQIMDVSVKRELLPGKGGTEKDHVDQDISGVKERNLCDCVEEDFFV